MPTSFTKRTFSKYLRILELHNQHGLAAFIQSVMSSKHSLTVNSMPYVSFQEYDGQFPRAEVFQLLNQCSFVRFLTFPQSNKKLSAMMWSFICLFCAVQLK